MKFPVIDLFAGPGGLSEGFSSFGEKASINGQGGYKVVVSVEKEKSARKTLLMRAFYRLLLAREIGLDGWYQWLNQGLGDYVPQNDKERLALEDAGKHARLHELGGDQQEDKNLENDILDLLSAEDLYGSSVLIGGPPCQAYSLVGRARNQGNWRYDAAKDNRHFLYREYLRIVALTQPAVFVMENVRGILSSKVNGKRVFPMILSDLVSPHEAMKFGGGRKYHIYSLVGDAHFKSGDDPDAVDGREFLIKSEQYGVPQRRHRVILLGVREDIVVSGVKPGVLFSSKEVSAGQVLAGLPELRSRLSKGGDSDSRWVKTVERCEANLMKCLDKNGYEDDVAVVQNRQASYSAARSVLLPGSLRVSNGKAEEINVESLSSWLLDDELKVALNHEARGHIEKDLERYLFVSTYGQLHKVSPKASNFPKCLAPKHKNWNSGKFSDRFRVQLAGQPSTTVTSHISKDGHYFIHPDPAQCRSLTVREAARLQTFPDNYIFMGSRTEQYVQVGNAVPPYLAFQIAEVVHDVLRQYETICGG